MGVLVLLRHGQSQWNLENKFTGWVDVDLSPKGEAEAEDSGRKLKGFTFDKVYTSVLKRANRTMDIALAAAGMSDLPTVYDEALNERHYGDLQGLNKAETAEKFGDEQVHIWRRSFDVPPPNGESLKDTAARVLPYWTAHIEPDLKAGSDVLIVAHGNSLRSLAMHLESMTQEEVLNLNIPTGVPLVYDFDPQSGEATKRGYLE
ncbi:2,3-bisphosphoglycerate-dependent phosphoglycerate mutase [Candidatus Poribacteria bacterium]|jgi:2,3-bisphosphoglycerate-dependent phosphoglycerate mutase|nr:2,3-bisphosphoglycerate-dependent phosphoglycerate mutase [Candidatus Poribacteria bacterium]MBT5534422.1 2,3-bisphosphoglycerate-dependent phosphoglycerate mutase [Candidatus Poribacteria bacterium]MBT5709588.1 2,3-bisphosphoglycerate-dependent phosphoglycerate mutase [Candidatus Poribacteria bacterium]MBT7096096.1 2,3-bisphosphoglycerate-dependent phosphoglycerate mutase [Candidatus Poribacteria bacterium]MBT7807541.1 2,3-bisphosphoglycerate-dependent phosphoglycerate mutase [Candidatus Po